MVFYPSRSLNGVAMIYPLLAEFHEKLVFIFVADLRHHPSPCNDIGTHFLACFLFFCNESFQEGV